MALGRFGADDCGHLLNVANSERSTDSIMVEFTGYTHSGSMGGHSHLYTFDTWIERYEDEEEDEVDTEKTTDQAYRLATVGKYTYAQIDAPSDKWVYSIVTDYQNAQDYGEIIAQFEQDAEPAPETITLFLNALAGTNQHWPERLDTLLAILEKAAYAKPDCYLEDPDGRKGQPQISPTLPQTELMNWVEDLKRLQKATQ